METTSGITQASTPPRSSAIFAGSLQNPAIDWPADGATETLHRAFVEERDHVSAYIDQAEARLNEARAVREALNSAIEIAEQSGQLPDQKTAVRR